MNITPVVRKQSSHFVAGKQFHSNICQRGSAKVVIDPLLIENRGLASAAGVKPPYLCALVWIALITNWGRVPADVKPWSIIYGTFLRHCLKHWSAVHWPTFLCDHTRMPSNTIYDLSGAHLMVFLRGKIVFLLQEGAQTPGEWIICPAYHHQSGILLDHAWSFDKPGPSGQHQHHMSQEGIFLGDDVFFSPAFVEHSGDDSEIHHHHQHHHHIQPLWTDTTPSPPSPPNTVMLLDYNGDEMTKKMMWKWKDFC